MAAGVVLLGLFLLIERRTRDPLMPLRLFGNRSLVTAVVMIFIFFGSVNSLHYLFFIHVQNGLGYDALEASLAFLPSSFLATTAQCAGGPQLARNRGPF